MPNEKKSRLPQFTVGNLLWLTTAVALGFAVSQSPPPESDPNRLWLPVNAADMRWPQGILSIGGILLVGELVSQAMQMVRQRHTASTSMQFAVWFAIGQRIVLSTAVFGLLVLRLLLNRRVMTIPVPEWTSLFADLWPDLLLVLALIVSVRMFLVRRPTTERSFSIRLLVNSVVLVGLAGLAAYVLIDRLLVTLLVHIAIEGVEKSHALKWQRPDVYPYHRGEGFMSFWYSAMAVFVVALAVGLLWWDGRCKEHRLRSSIRIAFAALIVSAGSYVWWFFHHEFPRISPEIASEGLACLWPDKLAGMLLVMSLSMVFGLRLARVRSRDERVNCDAPQLSISATTSAWAILIATGWDFIEVCRVWMSFTFSWGVPSWAGLFKNLAQILIMPELMIPLVLFVSALCLLWQSCRQPKAVPQLQPIDGKHLAGYTLATMALLVVAVPTLAAFGFCYWLGPLVL